MRSKIESAAASWFRASPIRRKGHEFYGLNTDVGSFFFDAATGAWARAQIVRKRQLPGRLRGHRLRRNDHGRCLYGQALHAFAGYVTTRTARRSRSSWKFPTLENNRERATLYALELFCETGVGTLEVPDPMVIMQYSRDGGRTWSNEMWRALGRIGEYLTRAVWRPNVEFRQLSIRFTLPDKTRRLVMGYFADVR
jgi:hypothetical protein